MPFSGPFHSKGHQNCRSCRRTYKLEQTNKQTFDRFDKDHWGGRLPCYCLLLQLHNGRTNFQWIHIDSLMRGHIFTILGFFVFSLFILSKTGSFNSHFSFSKLKTQSLGHAYTTRQAKKCFVWRNFKAPQLPQRELKSIQSWTRRPSLREDEVVNCNEQHIV